MAKSHYKKITLKTEIGKYGTKVANDRFSKIYKKELKKRIFYHWPEKKEDQMLWWMKCCKRSDML